MNAAKIHLSADELALMQNSGWILTKNSIIEKVCLQFSSLAVLMREEVNRRAGTSYNEIWKGPKISRGEKYQGLPYVMLDYPRVFEKDDVLAIRTFFWWGNYFSITLHVKGKYRAAVVQNLPAVPISIRRQVFISTSGNEWNHDVRSPDYALLSSPGAIEPAIGYPLPGFIKISATVECREWNEMHSILSGYFPILLQLAGF